MFSRKKKGSYDMNVTENISVQCYNMNSPGPNRGMVEARNWYLGDVNPPQTNNVHQEQERGFLTTRSSNDTEDIRERSHRVETPGDMTTPRMEQRPQARNVAPEHFLPDIHSKPGAAENEPGKTTVRNQSNRNNSTQIDENSNISIKSNIIDTTRDNFITQGLTLPDVRGSGSNGRTFMMTRDVIRRDWTVSADGLDVDDVSSAQVKTSSLLTAAGTYSKSSLQHKRRTDVLKWKSVTRFSKENKLDKIDVSNKLDKIDVSNKLDKIDVSNKLDKIDVSNKLDKIDVRVSNKEVLGFQTGENSKEDNRTTQVKGQHRKRETCLCPATENKEQLCEFVDKDIIGAKCVAPTQFGLTKITYLDYIASGRSLTSIERYLQHHVIPTYANTHTEVSFNGKQTSHFREEAKAIIRECVNATKDDVVIFTGSGSTSAVNKLVHALNIRPETNNQMSYHNVTVFIGPYEHHSNILPWRELKATVITVPQTENGLIDLQYLNTELQKYQGGPDSLLIGSFSAASNVTGILTDVNAVASLMHEHGGYAFFDYACAAPYTDIDMNPTDHKAYKDAVFVSPHKFIGGPQTPGILIAKQWLFCNPTPQNVGGGTVTFVRRTAHKYLDDIENREEGGTPAIIESVRAGLAFKLKAAFTPGFIMRRERELFKKAIVAWSRLPGLIILGNLEVDRLPIFSMLFFHSATGRFVHHNFIATVLNDVFGIQVRSGCACAGPYGMDLLGMTEEAGLMFENLIVTDQDRDPENKDSGQDSSSIQAGPRNLIFKPGFVRLNLPYFLSQSTLTFVLKAIRMTSEKAWLLLPQYNYDHDTGRWWHRDESNINLMKRLRGVTFKTGQLKVRTALTTQPHDQQITGSSVISDFLVPKLSSQAAGLTYSKILKRAQRIFADAEKVTRTDMAGTREEYSQQQEALRWFMLPHEAADILNRRKVKRVAPEDLPFMPEALRWKITRDQQLV